MSSWSTLGRVLSLSVITSLKRAQFCNMESKQTPGFLKRPRSGTHARGCGVVERGGSSVRLDRASPLLQLPKVTWLVRTGGGGTYRLRTRACHALILFRHLLARGPTPPQLPPNRRPPWPNLAPPTSKTRQSPGGRGPSPGSARPSRRFFRVGPRAEAMAPWALLSPGVLVRTGHTVLTWGITLVLFLHDTGEPDPAPPRTHPISRGSPDVSLGLTGSPTEAPETLGFHPPPPVPEAPSPFVIPRAFHLIPSQSLINPSIFLIAARRPVLPRTHAMDTRSDDRLKPSSPLIPGPIRSFTLPSRKIN